MYVGPVERAPWKMNDTDSTNNNKVKTKLVTPNVTVSAADLNSRGFSEPSSPGIRRRHWSNVEPVTIVEPPRL